MSSLTPHALHAVRRAFAARVDAAAARSVRHREPAGMPHALQDLGAFLAAAGIAAKPCAGERHFGMDGAAYAALADHPETVAAGEMEARRLLAMLRGGGCGSRSRSRVRATVTARPLVHPI